MITFHAPACRLNGPRVASNASDQGGLQQMVPVQWDSPFIFETSSSMEGRATTGDPLQRQKNAAEVDCMAPGIYFNLLSLKFGSSLCFALTLDCYYPEQTS
jgi:hypothetical protein